MTESMTSTALVRHAPVQSWFRLLGSELRLVFGRRRNQALLIVVALSP